MSDGPQCIGCARRSFVEYVAEHVKVSRHSPASDCVRVRLRLLEANLKRLRALIDEGVAAGFSKGWADKSPRHRRNFEPVFAYLIGKAVVSRLTQPDIYVAK